jgi:hypothetical protein
MLAGCGSSSMGELISGTPSTPPRGIVQLQSTPLGALATTSLGPSCKTPCELDVVAPADFSVTYTLDGFLPQTVPVNPKSEGVFAPNLQFDPNPVVAQLEPAPPRVGKRKPRTAGSAAPPHMTPASQTAAPGLR